MGKNLALLFILATVFTVKMILNAGRLQWYMVHKENYFRANITSSCCLNPSNEWSTIFMTSFCVRMYHTVFGNYAGPGNARIEHAVVISAMLFDKLVTRFKRTIEIQKNVAMSSWSSQFVCSGTGRIFLSGYTVFATKNRSWRLINACFYKLLVGRRASFLC